MKFINQRPYSDPAVAARKLLEIANATDAVQGGRIYIEKINGQFLFKEGGTPEEYTAGLACAVTKGWLWKHEVRNVCEIHACRCRDVRVKADGPQNRLLGATQAEGLTKHEISFAFRFVAGAREQAGLRRR
jgi:hypothetical protein